MTNEEIEMQIAAEGPPYELLSNLEGSELSQLNARAKLREIAGNATICEHELLLHGVRMLMVSQRMQFEQSVNFQLTCNPFAKRRIDQMIEDGYWDRTVTLPGFR